MESQRHPVSGGDYPGTFQKFDEQFSTEACLDYIKKLRWPKGNSCHNCGLSTEKPSLMGRGLFLCRKCKRQTSVTAGTLFHGTQKPLRMWFLIMWFVIIQKHGAGALGLQKVLGLGSYNTAWNWFHNCAVRWHVQMATNWPEPLKLIKPTLGGIGTKVRGRGANRKTIVAIAA